MNPPTQCKKEKRPTSAPKREEFDVREEQESDTREVSAICPFEVSSQTFSSLTRSVLGAHFQARKGANAWILGSKTPKPPEMRIKLGRTYTTLESDWPRYMDWPFKLGQKLL